MKHAARLFLIAERQESKIDAAFLRVLARRLDFKETKAELENQIGACPCDRCVDKLIRKRKKAAE